MFYQPVLWRKVMVAGILIQSVGFQLYEQFDVVRAGQLLSVGLSLIHLKLYLQWKPESRAE